MVVILEEQRSVKKQAKFNGAVVDNNKTHTKNEVFTLFQINREHQKNWSMQ